MFKHAVANLNQLYLQDSQYVKSFYEEGLQNSHQHQSLEELPVHVLRPCMHHSKPRGLGTNRYRKKL